MVLWSFRVTLTAFDEEIFRYSEQWTHKIKCMHVVSAPLPVKELKRYKQSNTYFRPFVIDLYWIDNLSFFYDFLTDLAAISSLLPVICVCVRGLERNAYIHFTSYSMKWLNDDKRITFFLKKRKSEVAVGLWLRVLTVSFQSAFGRSIWKFWKIKIINCNLQTAAI